MATPFVHQLAIPDDYGTDDLHEGQPVPMLGRRDWIFTLDLASVTSVTLVIQGSPSDDDADFVTLGTFEGGAITTAGRYTLTSIDGGDLTIPTYYNYLRSKATAQTGDGTFAIRGAAAFLTDAATDTALLSAELRNRSNTTDLTRIIEQSERDVRALLLSHAEDLAAAGYLDVHELDPSVYDEIRAMVAQQADWLFQREVLQKRSVTGDASAIVTLRDLPTRDPALSSRIRHMRNESTAYWRGR